MPSTNKYRPAATLLLILAAVIILQSIAAGADLSSRHPVLEGENLRTCTLCHESDDTFPFARYNHSLLFGEKHAAAAGGHSNVCRMCHDDKYCSTCHHANAGLKPSLKMNADPKSRTPHRGDYLTRHRIDGRLKPTTCFKCHGRPKTAVNCRACHGPSANNGRGR